ncbi:MAG: calcineurin-like phosphoesterase family protein [Fimbriimonadaceae bacterium]
MRRLALALSLLPLLAQAQTAQGYVYEDANKNNKKDANERGIRGVRVSDQRQITTTDASGKWTLPASNDAIYFVIKPRGYKTKMGEHNLPHFYYIHKPNGSPTGTKYEGVKPTGPLPTSIDFPLYKQEEPTKFKAVMFADPQPRDVREVEYVTHDVVEKLIGTDAAFGVTLGDIAFDNLETFGPQNAAIGLIGIPWYNVIGNHDINLDSPDDHHSDETFNRVFGPAYYSFDYGPTHFIVLDDVEFLGAGKGYRGGLGAEQMQWIKNDIALVPKNQLVVLMMHIPLVNVADRQDLYRLIETRPNVISISGHTHYQEHIFIGEKDGWKGIKPHHHTVNVTVSGSWWQGSPNELGIPHTTMRDGAPNGYSVFTFDGTKYSIEFRAAGSPDDHQMNIYAPEEVSREGASEVTVTVNVFGGSEKSVVEVRLNDGAWVKMDKVLKPDPKYAEAVARDAQLQRPFRPLPAPMQSPHLWEVPLDRLFGGQRPYWGSHTIEVRETDMFGKVHTSQRIIRLT